MWKVTAMVLAVLLAVNVTAQRMPATATLLSASEIDTVRKSERGDIQMLVTDAGKYNIGLATMRRNSSGRPENAIVHNQITEIYYVTDGAGTIVTGGMVTGAQALPPDNNVVKVLAGPTTMGGTIQGGQSQKIAKGDFVIIPPGVQHSFGSIDGSIEYLMVRIDADHVLPTGLLHDVIKKARQK